MQQATSTPFFTNWKPIEIMLAALFLVAPFYYHPNIGGEGLQRPNNITVWVVATLIIWFSLHTFLKRPSYVIPRCFYYIAAFPVLITFSGFVTDVEQPLKWLFRLLFIWGGLAFFFSLFQHGLKQGRLDRILFVIVVSALLQGLVGIAQVFSLTDMPFWLPKSSNGVPSGLFQQINNQATYQATAIMIAIFLISRPFLLLNHRWIRSVVIVTLASASYLIAISDSRIGVLTLVLGLFIIVPSLWKRLVNNKALSLISALSLLIGFSLGIVSETNSIGTSKMIDKTIAMQSGYSGTARIGMYSISYDLIRQQPILGHGIGSFPKVWQYAKPSFYQVNPDAVLPDMFVGHPHNELILWLVEAGVMAGAGLVLALISVILSLRRLGWQRGGAYAAMLLPVVVHTQVELPFYTSAIHWFLFILLLLLTFRHFSVQKQLNLSAMLIKTGSYTNFLLALGGLLFLAQTIRAQFDFYDFYHRPLSEQVSFSHAYANPYLRAEAQWIEMSSVLYSSIELGLNDNVRAYIRWGEKLLLEKPDIDLYKKLADAYYSLGEVELFCDVINRGAAMYPSNPNLNQALQGCRE